MSHYPKLRPLDLRPYPQNGQPSFLLRDPQQISEQPLLLPQALAAILPFCDGTRDVWSIANTFALHYGAMMPVAVVERLLATLDEALMLENERSAHAHVKALAAYRATPFRRPMMAGHAYPADAGALWRRLQNYLATTDHVQPLRIDWSTPIGLLSPHIDYRRGGAVYAQVWKRIAQAAQEADLAVLLGVDHYGSDPFTLTRQNYATPYGILPTAQAVIDALAQVIGEEAAFAGELRHRGEHSLELVAVWLHHIRRGLPCDLVPILCGGFQHFIENGSGPQTDPLIEQVLALLHTVCKGQRVLVVASGDLAHVGPAFGGPPLNDMDRTRIRLADEELIRYMHDGDADGFFNAIQAVGNANNVCGVAPIYLAMRTLGRIRGEPIGYATCPADGFGTSVVTVGGMIFC